MLFIIIYERFMRRDGSEEERPLAMFRNPGEARVYLEMLSQGGRRAFAKTV